MAPTKGKDLHAAKNFRTHLEAELAGKILDDEGIPYLIQSQEGLLHGPLSPGATIFVSEALLERAKIVLQDALLNAEGDE